MSDTTPVPSMNGKWRVTSQAETSEPNGQGQFVKGITVAFTTGHGVQGTVFVPEAQYNTDTVRQLIAQKVAALDAVGGLTG